MIAFQSHQNPVIITNMTIFSCFTISQCKSKNHSTYRAQSIIACYPRCRKCLSAYFKIRTSDQMALSFTISYLHKTVSILVLFYAHTIWTELVLYFVAPQYHATFNIHLLSVHYFLLTIIHQSFNTPALPINTIAFL